MESIQSDWPMWAIILYLFIKDGLPVVSVAVGKIVGTIVPAKAKQVKAALDAETELEARRIDLREREVIAMEQIGKTLAIIETRQQSHEKDLDVLQAGVAAANNALVVILDRVHRRREDYETKVPSAPVPETLPDASISK